MHSGTSPQNIERQHPVLQLTQLLFMSYFFFGCSSAPVSCCQYYNGRVPTGFSTYDQNNNNSCCWAWLVGQSYRVFNLVSRTLQTPYKYQSNLDMRIRLRFWQREAVLEMTAACWSFVFAAVKVFASS